MAKETSKEKILKAVEKVYQTSGLAKITVTDVCEAAKISRKTFYQRFKNLDDLFEALLHYISKRAISEVNKIDDRNIGYLDLLWNVFDIFADVARTHTVLGSIYKSRYGRWVDWNDENLADRFDKSIKKQIRGIIEKGQKNGEFREDLNPKQIAVLITTILGTINFLYRQETYKDVESEDLLEAFKSLLKSGIVKSGTSQRYSIE